MATPQYEAYHDIQPSDLVEEVLSTPDLDREGLAEAASKTELRLPYRMSALGATFPLERDGLLIGEAEIETITEPNLRIRMARVKELRTDPSNNHSAYLALLRKLTRGQYSMHPYLEEIQGLPGSKMARVAREIASLGLLPDKWQLDPPEADDVTVVQHRLRKIDNT